MIMYRCKMMLSRMRLENFNTFGQNISIENLNSMPSEIGKKILKMFVLFECKKV